MATQDEQPIRRVGQQGRKDELKVHGELFPPEDSTSLPDIPLPFDDDEGVAFLRSLPQGLVARPLRVTPPEERFPPLMPTLPPESAPTRPTTRQAAVSVAPKRKPVWVYHLVTLLAWLGMCAVVTTFALIWTNPYSVLNPFPPPIVYVYVTATPLAAPPPTFAAADAPPSLFPFVVELPVLYTSNNNGRGCAWASIAGTARDKEGRALNGYRVRISDSSGTTQTVFTGATLTFGDGGFEFPLGEAPRADTFTLQLASPQGTPLTEFFTLTTRAECSANVAVVNFIEN